MKGNKTILIVEDERPLRELMVDKLKKEGFEDVVSCENGYKAIKIIVERLPTNDVDLVLLDLDMPKLRGEHVVDFLYEVGIHIPVIVLSNNETLYSITETGKKTPLIKAEYLKSDTKISEIIDKVREIVFVVE